MSGFFRYPHTPHLAWLSPTSPRDDKVLSRIEAENLLNGFVFVEEKLDGANLGITLNDEGKIIFQNRGQYLSAPFTGQFTRLNSWVAQHEQMLASILKPGTILFGEWLAARHSIEYTELPDWFVIFDVYIATEGEFWSVTRRNTFAKKIELPVVPCLLKGHTDLSTIKTLAAQSKSKFGNCALEGLIVRRDKNQINECRAKLVRPDFTQAIGEHWRRRTLTWNRVKTS